MSLLLRLSLYFHLLIDLLYRRLHRKDKESSFSDPLPTNLASIPEHFRPYAIDRRDSPRGCRTQHLLTSRRDRSIYLQRFWQIPRSICYPKDKSVRLFLLHLFPTLLRTGAYNFASFKVLDLCRVPIAVVELGRGHRR
jgi:hypothetical protein